MSRPCRPDTRFFKRELTPAQRDVLLAAGQGDITQGWHELLYLFAQAHAQGYRPGAQVHFVSNMKQD